MVIEKTPITDQKYICECCDFKCSKKADWDRHIVRPKHINTSNGIEKRQKNATSYMCCGKVYKYYSGLCRHKIKCIEEKNSNSDVNTIIEQNKKLVDETCSLQKLLLEQHNEFKILIMDICKNNNNALGTNNVINSNNTNCNNKQFNLQFFLNEECKNAMNISDFMNSFTLQIADLEKVGSLGYVDGISDIIISKLKTMDIYSRPMHCSDAKRETIYVKDEGIWEKEEPSNTNIKKVVRNVEKKNMNVLNDWKDVHTDCLKSSSRQNEDYLKLIQQSMSGSEQNENKVIKRIMKEVIINKRD
jgi:hypothetical protein